MHGFELDQGQLAERPLPPPAVIGALDPHDDRKPQLLARPPALAVEDI